MRKVLLALVCAGICAGVYTGFVPGANPGAAWAEAGMEKLILLKTPKSLPDAELLDATDAKTSLAAYRGKWLVVNFWATWCAPCRHEMPSLAALQKARPDLVVLPIATGHNPLAQITRFYAEAGVESLPILRDPGQDLASAMAVLGLPVTVIVNPEGQEVARLIGGADWAGAPALAALAALSGQ